MTFCLFGRIEITWAKKKFIRPYKFTTIFFINLTHDNLSYKFNRQVFHKFKAVFL